MHARIRSIAATIALAAAFLIPTSTSAAAAGTQGPATSLAGAGYAYPLQKSCPNNTHLVIRYKIKAGREGGLFVGRSLSAMWGNNVQYDGNTGSVRSKVYDTHMSGRVYWGHGTGAWAGSVVDHSSYGTCATGV